MTVLKKKTKKQKPTVIAMHSFLKDRTDNILKSAIKLGENIN